MSGLLFDLMNPEPEPVQTARTRGHRAADACAAKADTVLDGWTQTASEYLQQFAWRQHRLDTWLMEDARAWAYAEGLAQPPDARAWGAVVRKVEASGLIEACGYAPAKSSNGSPKVQWRRRS